MIRWALNDINSKKKTGTPMRSCPNTEHNTNRNENKWLRLFEVFFKSSNPTSIELLHTIPHPILKPDN